MKIFHENEAENLVFLLISSELIDTDHTFATI